MKTNDKNSSKLESTGIKVDDTYLKKLSKNLRRLITIEKEIYKISGKINIGSPKQLGEIIYNDLKIAKLKKLKAEV